MGSNIVKLDYENNKIIISDETDDPLVDLPLIILADKLYVLIKKWADIAVQKVPTIVITRDNDDYDIKIE